MHLLDLELLRPPEKARTNIRLRKARDHPGGCSLVASRPLIQVHRLRRLWKATALRELIWQNCMQPHCSWIALELNDGGE